MDHYRVIKEVGRGSFGMAQLVTDTRDGARYILKRTRLARQPERQREATIMEMFIQKETCHRNVVRCKESWMEKGFVACLLLEYCVGGELADLLSARRPKELLDEETMRVWFVQVASALAYLHSNNIIHRDVKAANIFMREDSSLALGDFGLSQTPSTSEELAHTILGTPQHMAPELLVGKYPTYDEKSDVWALGVLFYEISALKTPFTAFDMKGLTNKICKAATPPLPSVFSSEWRELIRSCLRKNPEERPTVMELLESPALQPAVEEVSARYGAEVEEGAEAATVVIPEHSCAEILADCKKGSAASRRSGSTPIRQASGRLPAVGSVSRASGLSKDSKAAKAKTRPVSSRLPPVGRDRGAVASARDTNQPTSASYRTARAAPAPSQASEVPSPPRKPRVPAAPRKPKAKAASITEEMAALESKLGETDVRKPRVPVLSQHARRGSGNKGMGESRKKGETGTTKHGKNIVPKVQHDGGRGTASDSVRGVGAEGVGRVAVAGKQRTGAGELKEPAVSVSSKVDKKPQVGSKPTGAPSVSIGTGDSKESAAARRAAYGKAVARRGPAHGRRKVVGNVDEAPREEVIKSKVKETEAQLDNGGGGGAKTRLLEAVAVEAHEGHRTTVQANVGKPSEVPREFSHINGTTGLDRKRNGGHKKREQGQGDIDDSALGWAGWGMEEAHDEGGEGCMDGHIAKGGVTTASKASDFPLRSLFGEVRNKGRGGVGAPGPRPRIAVGVKHYHGVDSLELAALLSPLPGPITPALSSSKKEQLSRKRGAPTLKGSEGTYGVYFSSEMPPLARAGQRLTSSMYQLASSVEAYDMQPSPTGVKRHHHSIDNSVDKMGQALSSLLGS